MPAYRSRTTTHGRNMAGARGLWRATGMKDEDFGKPIIAVVNSFTQFVPGHVHLKDLGQLVAREIEKAGGVAKEFNTIAVDDGIAMGHDGMLYSLPSRELIADSVEYMVNAHCADAMVCISNCDKITPGMLMAALRLNIPTVFVSGGPMEAGKVNCRRARLRAVDLIDAMVAAADEHCQRRGGRGHRALGLPDLRLVLGHVHRQFDELPDRGAGPVAARQRLGAGDACRPQAAVRRGRAPDRRSGAPLLRAGRRDRAAAQHRELQGVRERHDARHRHGRLDQHGAASAGGRPRRRASPSPWPDIDRLSRRVPVLCKVAPSVPDVHLEDVHRAGGIMAILGELDRAGLLNRELPTVHSQTLGDALDRWDIRRTKSESVRKFFMAAPGGVPTQVAFSQERRFEELDPTARRAVIRDAEHAFSKDGGLAVLSGQSSRSTAAS